MDNTMNFEELMGEVKSLRTGDIVTGEVIAVNEAEVFVNIGYKSDGVIKKAEFMKDLYESLTSVVAIGDTVEAMITEMNDGTGNVALSKLKVDEMAAINVVGEKFEAKELVKGKITKIVKGGVIVDLGFATAFMPGNQYGLKYIEDLNTLLGKEVEGRIIEFDREKNRVIFSRKVVLVEE
ncbi:MAG: S1 RNA-binding domain-containing protein, partial [Eubacteriaceae bacterium]|nr:S1 RNA-binding domain-containing protein [Eubacteriaceae bacterium]